MKIKGPAGTLLTQIELSLSGDEAKWFLETIQAQLADLDEDTPSSEEEYVVKIFGGETS